MLLYIYIYIYIYKVPVAVLKAAWAGCLLQEGEATLSLPPGATHPFHQLCPSAGSSEPQRPPSPPGTSLPSPGRLSYGWKQAPRCLQACLGT